MSSDPLIQIDTVALLVSVVACSASVYRSLMVRRVLVSPVYRSRALWTGVVALLIAAFDILQVTTETYIPSIQPIGTVGPNTPGWALVGVAIISTAGVLIIFAWIDSTVQVALDLDFLHRDAIHWKGVRRYLWVVVVATGVASGLTVAPWQYYLVGGVIAVLLAYSGGVLVVGGRRVIDSTMRKYMRWMGLLVVAVIFEILTSSINFYLNFPLVIFGYFLYRAAGSLSKNVHVDLAKDPGRPV